MKSFDFIEKIARIRGEYGVWKGLKTVRFGVVGGEDAE